MRSLENLLISSESVQDRVFLGHVLFLLYARGRWSDGLHIESLVVDDPPWGYIYITGNTKSSKSSTTVAKKTTFLPLTAVANGLVHRSWYRVWLDARAAAGLVFGPGTASMPSLLRNGDFGSEALPSSAATLWLREALVLGGSSVESVAGVSTHSLKSTMLSWLAKRGIDTATRQLLGYHSQGLSLSMLHYSRDALSGPLRVLGGLLHEIRSELFFPDLGRSGYLANELAPPETRKPEPVPDDSARDLVALQASQAAEAESSSEGDSTSSSSDSNTSLDERAAGARPGAGRGPAKVATATLYRHRRLNTLHKAKSADEADGLACG